MLVHTVRFFLNATVFLVALLLKQSVTYLVCLACVCRMAYVETTHAKTIRKFSKFVRPPSSPNTLNQSECRATKMLPPSGQPLSESECRNLGHDPGKQDGGSATQCFEAFLVLHVILWNCSHGATVICIDTYGNYTLQSLRIGMKPIPCVTSHTQVQLRYRSRTIWAVS